MFKIQVIDVYFMPSCPLSSQLLIMFVDHRNVEENIKGIDKYPVKNKRHPNIEAANKLSINVLGLDEENDG